MVNNLFVVVFVGVLGTTSAANCAQDGSDYSYTESISGSKRTIVTNHCPNHPQYNLNPNTAVLSSRSYELPANPTYVGTATDSSTGTANIDLSQRGGGVGVFFSAAFLYSPYGGPNYGRTTSWTTSATYAEGNTFDQCGGHGSSTSSPSYHYHVPPSCLLRQLGQTDTAHSPQIGWAFDGFPVYGPRGPSGTQMKTCTQTSGTYGTDICTDACGGYYRNDNTIDNFVYRYYMLGTYSDGTSCALPGCPSPDSTYYPVSPLCFRGCCPTGVSCESFVTSCSSAGTTSNGYTNSYTAAVPTVNSLSLASGLPTNSGGCACGNLACSVPCSSSSWSSSSCGAGPSDSRTNTCGSSSTSDTSTSTAFRTLSLNSFSVVVAIVAFCTI